MKTYNINSFWVAPLIVAFHMAYSTLQDHTFSKKIFNAFAFSFQWFPPPFSFMVDQASF